MFERCLISVSDKSHLDQLIAGLAEVAPNCQILSTGGTAKALRDLGCENLVEISDYTGFPECFEGRVKTLHPKIHGGILFRRGQDEAQAQARNIEPIDLVVVNLYPFEQTYLAGSDDLVEMIDIGGPTLLRSAAKNCESVAVLCDPRDYQEFLNKARAGEVDLDFRRRLRARVFAHTASYDAKVAAALCEESYPEQLTVSFKRKDILRYGENPHQGAAVYQQDLSSSGLPAYQQHGGKALSYNNLLDTSASVMPLAFGQRSTCCVVKHAAPCGLADAASNAEAFELAWAGDPVSAFGSVVAFSQPVGLAEAELVKKKFVEVVVAPAFEEQALAVLREKSALRLVCPAANRERQPQSMASNILVQKGLALLQEPDEAFEIEYRQVSGEAEPDQDFVRFGLTAVRCLKSNAIALVRRVNGAYQTIGLGGGQPNRVQALRIAVEGARTHFGEEVLKEALLISDAFFPFPDSIETAAAAGIRQIVAPGGSKRDGEVTEAAQRLGVSLTFVNHRFFRH